MWQKILVTVLVAVAAEVIKELKDERQVIHIEEGK